jgi:hypothetical protein
VKQHSARTHCAAKPLLRQHPCVTASPCVEAACSPDHSRTAPSAAALTNSSARSSPTRGLPGTAVGLLGSSWGYAGPTGGPMGLRPATMHAVEGLLGDVSWLKSGAETATPMPPRDRMSSVCPASVRRQTRVCGTGAVSSAR